MQDLDHLAAVCLTAYRVEKLESSVKFGKKWVLAYRKLEGSCLHVEMSAETSACQVRLKAGFQIVVPVARIVSVA